MSSHKDRSGRAVSASGRRHGAGKEKKKKETTDPKADAFLRSIEEKLGMSVGSRVAIKLGRGKNAHSGTISITFKNDEEFERITEFLNGKR